MTIYTDGYIEVQGKSYECTQKLKEKLSYCTNMKENEDWFREV